MVTLLIVNKSLIHIVQKNESATEKIILRLYLTIVKLNVLILLIIDKKNLNYYYCKIFELV